MKNLKRIIAGAIILLTIGIFTSNIATTENIETSKTVTMESSELYANTAIESKCGGGKTEGKSASKADVKAESKCGEGKCGEGKCGSGK